MKNHCLQLSALEVCEHCGLRPGNNISAISVDQAGVSSINQSGSISLSTLAKWAISLVAKIPNTIMKFSQYC